MTIFQKLKLLTDYQSIRQLEFISTLDIFREIYINGAEISDINSFAGCEEHKIASCEMINITDILVLENIMYFDSELIIINCSDNIKAHHLIGDVLYAIRSK